MRYVLALAVLAAGARAQQVAANENLAAVKGVVTNAVTGEHLPKAFVRLHPASGNARPAITDEQGRFSYENLEPGTYKLEAEHVGFLLSLLTDDAGGPMELHLGPGETADVKVKLTPQAAISGRLLDSDGDPWVHGYVNVSRSVFKQGKRQLESTGNGGEVDDRGQFRVGQLAPGTYYVNGLPDVGWELQNPSPGGGLQSAWYPNSFDIQDATPVLVSPGQELTGLEIRLRRSATYRIRGTVSGLDTIPKVAGQPAPVYRRVWASTGSGVASNGHTGNLKPDGSFEIVGVPSGEYDVGLTQGMPPIGLGQTKVRVDDRDVDGVSLEVARTYALKGSVRFESNEQGRISGLNIMLTPLERSGVQYVYTQEDGSFNFPVVSMGRYRVFVPGTYDGQYHVKLFRYGGKETRGGIISIAEGDSPLELIFSSHGARAVVDVKRGDTAAPVMAAEVVLIPDLDNGEERGFGTRPAVRDQNGVYSIGNIPAGAYRLFAFESVPDQAWVDAEFWKEIRSKGVELRITEGEFRNAEVPLVLKSEIAGLLSRLGME